jgi:hypothetical protein
MSPAATAKHKAGYGMSDNDGFAPLLNNNSMIISISFKLGFYFSREYLDYEKNKKRKKNLQLQLIGSFQQVSIFARERINTLVFTFQTGIYLLQVFIQFKFESDQTVVGTEVGQFCAFAWQCVYFDFSFGLVFGVCQLI